VSKYVIRKLDSGFKFDLRATNGEGILTSEVYESLGACRKGIESVRKNAPKGKLEDRTVPEPGTVTNPKFELYRDRAGTYRFRLRARNGQIIGSSSPYTARSGALKGIDSVRDNAATEKVAEE
jgi:uncharacterized protein YegP (UPF0339 family)